MQYMSKRPKIFITNDDGIHSPGLRAAVHAVLELGDILVVAPSTQQTGMGRSFKGEPNAALQPIHYEIEGRFIEAYHCDCTPALAVHHGLSVLCADRKPDLLIAGINYGENVGVNITTSGTIGAAFEGASRRIPSLAVSLQTAAGAYFDYTKQDWSGASYFLTEFARMLLANKLPPDVDVLKIDVPDNADCRTPWRLTSVSRQSYYSMSLENPSLESTISDLTLKIVVDHPTLEADSDVHALTVDRVVSVTPLSLNLTSRTDFAAIYEVMK